MDKNECKDGMRIRTKIDIETRTRWCTYYLHSCTQF